MTEEIYWIWLQQALGIGSYQVDRIAELLDSPARLYEMDEKALRDLNFLTDKEIKSIQNLKLDSAKQQYERAIRLGCQVITPNHPDYPEYFTHIPCRPCVLYVLGKLSEKESPLSITVVGTRDCTEYGLWASHQISKDLAAAGCTIVSGLARGIDQAAHQGALAVHGRTIGILACGMDVDYPKESNTLKRTILNENGVLITEFPFGDRALPHHFRIRNRLMAGISDGTLVVQAPASSGALLTAQFAREQDRDLFAVPGGIFDRTMVGCNRLLKDGCPIVLNAMSILEEYRTRLGEQTFMRMAETLHKMSGRKSRGNAPPKQQQTSQGHSAPVRKEPVKQAPAEEQQPILTQEQLAAKGVSPEARQIYGTLGRNPIDCDAIVNACNLPVSAVISALTELELQGLIQPEPGRRYRI